MPRREDERWASARESGIRSCPACHRYGRYDYNEKLLCWTCGWCGRSFPDPGFFRYRDELEEHRSRIKARDRQIRRERRKRHVLIALAFIVTILVGILYVYAAFIANATPRATPVPGLGLTLTPTPVAPRGPIPIRQQTPPPSPTPKITPSPTPTPTPGPTPSLRELVQYALELINKDRRDHGLPPVVLGNNSAAQKHAEDMLRNNYYSHWGMDGMKPYMRYTLAGGFNYEAENISSSGKASYGYRVNPKRMLEEAQKGLMDSPDHRRNILNKWHKKVNIGIAYNNRSFYLVQQFEGDYIEFSRLPTISGDTFSMAGKVALGTISSVAFYYDPLPKPLTREQLAAPPYDYAYSLGERVGSIIPPPPPGYFYADLPSDRVLASRWSLSPDGFFVIEAKIGPLLSRGKGVYTVVTWVKIGDEYLNITNYSIFVE